MSGHSHWATIKHKKGAADAKKGVAFSKVSKLLTSAARAGGGDPKSNLKLAYAMEKARECNMPKDNVEKAIKRGTGEIPGIVYEESIYEGFAAGGVAVMIDALTDNKNRTTAEIRKIFDIHGGSMAASNAVSWIFDRKGLIAVPAADTTEDTLMGLALDAGADNLELSGDAFEITCDPRDIEKIKAAITAAKIKIQAADVTMIPKNYVTVGSDTARKVMALLAELEGHEDVQNVYANADIVEQHEG
jgi:YebC/PmpR family DNA-binding regulatory protein